MVPKFAKVGVYRKDFQQPTYAIAFWEEYCPDFPNQMMWAKMPHVMLAKVAEALALRKAFPKQMGGVYTKEEMEQADDVPGMSNVAKTVSKTEPIEEVRNLPVNPGDDEIDEVINGKIIIPPPVVEDPPNLVNAVEKLAKQVDDAKTIADYDMLDGKLTVALEKTKNYPELAKKVEAIGNTFAEKFSLLKKDSVEVTSDEFEV
jgi:hypothetical protein